MNVVEVKKEGKGEWEAEAIEKEFGEYCLLASNATRINNDKAVKSVDVGLRGVVELIISFLPAARLLVMPSYDWARGGQLGEFVVWLSSRL